MVGKTSDVGSPAEQVPSSKEERNSHRSVGDRARHPFPALREKLKGTHLYDVKVGAIHLKHTVGKLENLVNTNHRHDEEHEQKTDRKRTLIAESHRFQSFAPERDGNRIKWYVDGRDYFHAVSVALERATETIYIADWWISPELFLRRPPHVNQEWRLDYILKRAAERGVRIYVIVYKEVKQALTCNSAHTKQALEALCPEGSPGHGNIVIMRHPDHNFFENAGDMTFYWAHHEKFIVIDYDLAFIGGLDLCFGRWDCKQHPLADVHPAGVQNEVFPGQDFNNNRIMDFQTVEDWKTNELSKTEYGRMPWHDVAMGVIGPCVYDIAEHFVLRWNFCKRDKYKRDEEYDWLTMTGRTGDQEDLIGVQRPKHPVGEYINHPLTPLENKRGNPYQGHLVQKEDQAEPGAEDEEEEEVFHDAPEDLDEHGYTEKQHRRPETWLDDQLQSHKIHRPHMRTDKTLPKLPGEASQRELEHSEPDKQEYYRMTGNDPRKEGTVTASGGVHEKSKGYRSNIADYDVSGGHGTVHAQIVRSSADWSSGILTEQSIQNAYCQIIRDAKHFVYIENQFFITATGENQAPIHNLIGKAIVDACVNADKEGRKFRVIIVIPCIPGFAGDLRSDAATGTRAIMDYQYKSICRGEHSIYGRIKDAGVDPTQYIFVFNLRSYDRINNTPALKKQQETSGVTYQEVQRAQAEEIMGEVLHGAPGEKTKKPAKKKGEGRRTARKGQPTGPKQLLKHNVQKQAESSESESDLDEPSPQQGAATGAEKKRMFEERREDVGLAHEGKDDRVQSVDSIAKDALLSDTKPSEENYAGRSPGKTEAENAEEEEEAREQEKENFIQEQLYIHGKVRSLCTDKIWATLTQEM
jgi:phospholipase D1/2